MANPRTFPIQTATPTAQPLLGSPLTANISACAINSSSGGTGGQSIAVADSSIFKVGDYVNIIPVAGATTPKAEYQVPVTAIPDGTHIVALNSAPHNSGDWVQLWWPCAQLRIQEIKGAAPAGSLFLGSGPDVDTSGNNALEDLSLDVTFQTPIRQTNSDNAANYWIISSSGSPTYQPTLWQE